MSSSSSEVSPYQAAWNQFVIEVRTHIDSAADYVRELSEAEKLMGVGLFVTLFLIMILVLLSSTKNSSGGNSRQFSGAMFVVIVVAFGVGWTWDSNGGGLAHLFGR